MLGAERAVESGGVGGTWGMEADANVGVDGVGRGGELSKAKENEGEGSGESCARAGELDIAYADGEDQRIAEEA